jgi:hypothetical protein
MKELCALIPQLCTSNRVALAPIVPLIVKQLEDMILKNGSEVSLLGDTKVYSLLICPESSTLHCIAWFAS